MAVTVSATLAGLRTPSLVQVVVDGVNVGDAVIVQGVVDGTTWTLRGGAVTASSTQVIVLDDLTPPNRPVTYQAVVNGAVQATSDAISIAYLRDYLLTSIDGQTVIPILWRDNADPRSMSVNQSLTWVPGRRHPVLRFAAGGGETGTWIVSTESAADTSTLRELIASGAPVVMRSSGRMADLELVQIVALSTASRTLASAALQRRVWSLDWTQIDDPLASTPAIGDTFANVDAAYPGTTFAELDGAYTGTTFGDWNRKAWAGA